MIRVRQTGDTVLLPLKVTPKGGRDTILAYQEGDEAIKLKVAAPPEEGKANARVLTVLAELLNVSKSRLRLASGQQSRHKQVAVLLEQSSQAQLLLGVLAQAMQSNSQRCFEYALS